MQSALSGDSEINNLLDGEVPRLTYYNRWGIIPLFLSRIIPCRVYSASRQVNYTRTGAIIYMRKAEVFRFERLAGRFVEMDDGSCQFAYDVDYMKEPGAEPVSPTMPFREEPYWSDEMLPFSDGLIPEGWP